MGPTAAFPGRGSGHGAYAVIEVKQALTRHSLDAALGKLVTCHRLGRPLVPIGELVENRLFGAGSQRIGNPLFSAIVATRRDPDTPVGDLVERCLAVNRRLDRLETVHCLCILGDTCYLWGWVPRGSREADIATFLGPQDLRSR
ncbi:hypothetical protein [Streptomyces sp. NPDC101234]|uniref:hypothetical protein n=1 Tax=Streptomyces sp. NPDC101234 TaxID=3366138 RepID=UPI0038250CAD